MWLIGFDFAAYRAPRLLRVSQRNLPEELPCSIVRDVTGTAHCIAHTLWQYTSLYVSSTANRIPRTLWYRISHTAYCIPHTAYCTPHTAHRTPHTAHPRSRRYVITARRTLVAPLPGPKPEYY
eukprot:2729469-Rhodomonas_salina.1